MTDNPETIDLDTKVYPISADKTLSMRDLLDYFGIARPKPDHRALPDATAELMLWEELDSILKAHPRAQLS